MLFIRSIGLATVLGLLPGCSPHPEPVAATKPLSPREDRSPAAGETFTSLMHAAMARMDVGMSVACTNDPDRDFAAMMIPHHQGAVDMALLELQFGRDERLRRLAQGIIVEQRQEIALMQDVMAKGVAK
ncbi:MAG TPA: DUF305 domain-containing protein [Polyangiaceae bacterium]